MDASPTDISATAVDPRHVSYTHLMYGLHAVAIVVGILTAATIVGQFIFSLPSIVAVIMNYARRNRVQGTWLATHFRWQLRTFWFSVLWVVLASLLFGPLILVFIGYPLLALSLFAVGIWAAWRIARGWMALRDGRPMPT
jgi:uncharacterized membrane protein